MPVATETEGLAYASLRALQVDAGSGEKPKIVAEMGDWQYRERFLHGR